MNNLFNTFPFGSGPFNVDQRGLDISARERVLSAVCAAGFVVVGEAVGVSGLQQAIAADHFTIERRPLLSTNVSNDEPPAYFDVASGALVFSQVEAAEALGDEAAARTSDMETRERGSAWFRGVDADMETRELGSAWFRDRVTVAEVPASVSSDPQEMPKSMAIGDTHGDSMERTLAAIRAAGYAISAELKTLVETKVPFTFVAGAIIRDVNFIATSDPTCAKIADVASSDTGVGRPRPVHYDEANEARLRNLGLFRTFNKPV